MDEARASDGGEGLEPAVYDGARQGPNHRDLMMRFESLGGSGHGPEFAIFQQRAGGEPTGLLAYADLGAKLLIDALRSKFDGVGLENNTIVFTPVGSDEWWTKDKRYWMAMRSFIKTDGADAEQALATVCERHQLLREKLIADLEAGEKVFLFKTMHESLDEAEVSRLLAAVRAYGDSTLFYIRYADDAHPGGTVIAAAPGLLIGYIDHFNFSADNKPLGRTDTVWLALCERAARLHQRQSIEPVAASQAIAAGPETSLKRSSRRRSGRRIVLIGNCQVQAMAGLYKRFVAKRSGDIVEHVPSYQDLTDEHRVTIRAADIVVEQLFDLKPQADTDAVSTTTPRIFIPMVTAAFLWPFAGSPHPKNAGTPYLAGGPYGGEAADSYLNRLILSGTDPDQAVETYADLDVNSRVNLDRLFEIVMDRQRSRDEAAGYRIAEIIEQHFRTEQIFLSPYHPNVRIATALADQLFAQLGAGPDEIDRMRDCTRITPFPKGELPFHPSVCRHFGLDFVAPGRRYRFLNEGLFTFHEYALRYMRYEWNDALAEGMHLSQNGDIAGAHDRLTVAVARSPLSAEAHNALSHVFNRRGARDEAIAMMRRAVELEPEWASYHANLGNVLRGTGRIDEALDELRRAVALDPVEPHYLVLLSHLLRQLGSIDSACDSVREAVRLDPDDAGLQGELANCLEAKGAIDQAVEVLREAVAMEPANDNLLQRLAHLLGRLDRLDEAIEVARTAVLLAPESVRTRVVLSDLLLRKGDPVEALNEAYVAVVREPDNAHAYGHLGHVLNRTTDLPAAEAAFRRAARLKPGNAHYRHEISSVLHRQQRFSEAIAAAREAAELETDNPNRWGYLASLTAQHGDLRAAITFQRRAVDLRPEDAAFRSGLSALFERQDQLDEASAAAGVAAEY